MEIAEPLLEAGLRPDLFEVGLPFFLGDLDGRPRIRFVHERRKVIVAAIHDLGVARFDLLLLFFGDQ